MHYWTQFGKITISTWRPYSKQNLVLVELLAPVHPTQLEIFFCFGNSEKTKWKVKLTLIYPTNYKDIQRQSEVNHM